jgi:hypothetical protein
MRTADYQGALGEAWMLPLEPKTTPAHYAALYSSLIRAPRAHMLWQWHLLTVIHLRDIVGVRPAHKQYPEAEYEIGVYAIDPASTPDPEHPPFNILRPEDIVVQFHGINDDQAKRIGELATKACVVGRLIPDSDYRPTWKVAIAETVEHLRQGKH